MSNGSPRVKVCMEGEMKMITPIEAEFERLFMLVSEKERLRNSRLGVLTMKLRKKLMLLKKDFKKESK